MEDGISTQQYFPSFFGLFCSWWIVYFIHILCRWILHLYLCRWITFVFHAGEFYICILYRWHFMLFLQVNFTLVFFYESGFSIHLYFMQVTFHLYFLVILCRWIYICILCIWILDLYFIQLNFTFVFYAGECNKVVNSYFQLSNLIYE